MRIALDVMGGDHGPAPVVAGALEAVQTNPNIILTLVGDRGQIEPLIQNLPEEISSRVGTHHASQVLTMEDHPLLGLRKKPDCSILRTWQLMAERKVEAIVSPGNTGAVVAAGLRLKKFLKYVRRPGIATVMPTMKGPCVMIDVGANAAPKATHLFQYGVMGSIYARKICNKEHPTIGLMNIGSESAKGHDLAKETYELFKASHLSDRFVGNIEGRDIHRGATDVVVCDGFVGNVILKVCEGLFEFVLTMTGQALNSALDVEKLKGLGALKQLSEKYDYAAVGGAPLLGIDGICIICHGSSKERAIKNALLLAAKEIDAGLNQHIVKELEADPALAAAAANESDD
ncbi:MAG: phosphate acyltransferase PlsX [Planctomycetia bacterium]|nr:phosphate acyltransferase PlsX [Planctomycetia bacterium]